MAGLSAAALALGFKNFAGDCAVADPRLDSLRRRLGVTSTTSWRNPTAADFLDYFASGDRGRYDQMIEHDVAKLGSLVLSQQLWPSGKGAGELVSGLRSLAARTWWHLPAHERDRPSRAGSAPLSDNRSIDMCSAEIGSLVCWALELHEGQIESYEPGLAAQLRRRVISDVLERYLKTDAAWVLHLTKPTNWNPWINHRVLACASLLPGDEFDRAALLSRVRDSLDAYVRTLPDDGCCEEGFTYWWQGPAHALEIAEAEPGLWGADGIASKLIASLRFPIATAVNSRSALTFSDSERWIDPSLPWSLVWRWAVASRDENLGARAAALAAYAVPLPSINNSIERVLYSMLDGDWLSATSTRIRHKAPRFEWFSSSGLVVERSLRRTAEQVTCYSLGHNDQLHNHLDVGGFALWLGGAPVVIDLGAPTYTSATFGGERYSNMANGSDWHSVPTVAGNAQRVGRDARAKEISIASGVGGSVVAAKLDAAYSGSPVPSWRRTFSTLDSQYLLEVQDEWEADEDIAPSEIRIVLPGGARQTTDGIFLQAAGCTICVTVDGATETIVECRLLDDPRLRKAWGEAVCRVRILGSASGRILTRFELVETDSAARGQSAAAPTSGPVGPRP